VKVTRDYAAAKPESASAQARLARVLLAAGAGQSALLAARKAVEMDPKSTQAWQALAWVYQHDSFGQRFALNWNPMESEKAYRKAIETAADPLVPATDLAILLEHNAQGDRYGKGARLQDAIDIYRQTLKKTPNSVIQQNLAMALVRAGSYDEAQTEIKKLGDTQFSLLLSSMVTCLSQGSDRAILDLQAQVADPAVRTSLMAEAAVTLAFMRKYELAMDFLRAARRISNSQDVQTRMASLGKFKRTEDGMLPDSDPRSVVQKVFDEMFSGHILIERLRPFFTKHETFSEFGTTSETEARKSVAALQGRFRSIGFSGESVKDVLMSALELTSTGDEELGYRISGETNGTPMLKFFVVREDGGYKVLGSSDSPENVGKLVLELMAANKLAQARQWLTLLINGTYWKPGETVTETSAGLSGGSNGSDSPAAKFLWNGLTEKQQTADIIRTTAASLIGTFSASEEAIRILKQARAAAANKLDRGNIDLALCQAYAKAAKWTELLQCANDIKSSFAVADKSFGFRVKAFTGLKQWHELEQDARQQLKNKKEDAEALRAAITANLRAGTPEKAAEFVAQLEKLSYNDRYDRALIAWYALFTSTADAKLIDKIGDDTKSDAMENAGDYLLGLLQVHSAKIEDARAALVKALALEEYASMDARPWVLHGKIQEQLGNTEEVSLAFAEAAKRAGEGVYSLWALKLATLKPKP